MIVKSKIIRQKTALQAVHILADPTRLELATSAVTGQRSNQLSYESTEQDYIVSLLIKQ